MNDEIGKEFSTVTGQNIGKWDVLHIFSEGNPLVYVLSCQRGIFHQTWGDEMKIRHVTMY